MKLKALVLALTVIIFSTTLIAGNNPVDNEAVKSVINQYAQCLDSKDTSTLEDLLYTGAKFVCYNSMRDVITEYDADQFLAGVKKGKLGGWKRDVTIISVDTNEKTAMVKVEFTDARLKTTEYISIVKVDGAWKIVNCTSTLEKNS